MQPLLTREAVAEVLGVHPNTIDSWRSAGSFPQPIRFPNGRTIRWRPENIEAWLAERADGPTSDAAPGTRRGSRKSPADHLV